MLMIMIMMTTMMMIMTKKTIRGVIYKTRIKIRDRGGGGAGRAVALPLFCWDIFSRAPVDMEKVLVEVLDFSLKGGR